MNIRGTLIQGLVEDLIHKLHHGSRFILLVNDIDLFLETELIILPFAIGEKVFKNLSAYPVKFLQPTEHPPSWRQFPRNQASYGSPHQLSIEA